MLPPFAGGAGDIEQSAGGAGDVEQSAGRQPEPRWPASGMIAS